MAEAPVKRGRATKIVATVGKNGDDPAAVRRILLAGADVVRINGAHVRPGEIARRVAVVRGLERELGRPVGVLLDLGGPKIRVGPVEGMGLEWRRGDSVRILPGKVRGSGRTIGVTYPALLADVKPGAEIRIDDGKIALQVEAVRAGALTATVLTGGVVKAEKGVNFPESALSAPALTAKDARDLAEGLSAGVDLVGLSFVRSAAHVAALRRRLSAVPEEARPWIVAKIERAEALREIRAIAEESDVLMVARGDLGVEIGLAGVPGAQRAILEVGRRLGVPVIVATQMLESMIESPVPTRAEVSDVAGAVHDGADAVMLSGETAVGAHPVEAVLTMGEIARTAEAFEGPAAPLPERPVRSEGFGGAIAWAGTQLARAVGATALVVYTESGRTARLVSKQAPAIPVVALTPREAVRRRMAVLRNVTTVLVPKARTVEEMIRAGDRHLRRTPYGGTTVVELSGAAVSEGATNTLRVRTLPITRRRRRGAGREAAR